MVPPQEHDHPSMTTATAAYGLAGHTHHHAPPAMQTKVAMAVSPQQQHHYPPLRKDDDGKLRDGPRVNLLDANHVGLAVNAFMAGAVYTFLQSGYRPLLGAYLAMHHADQFTAAKYLFEWPGALAVFIGLLTDCMPLYGYRRKSYVITGWAFSVAMFSISTVLTWFASTEIIFLGDPALAAQAIANADIQQNPVLYGYLFLMLSVLGVLGLQVAWISSLAFMIEFAQCEPVRQRGHLQALYFIIFYGAGMLADIVTAQILDPSDDGGLRASITLGEGSMILAILCILPVPCIAAFLREEGRAQRSMGVQIHNLWVFCHYDAVYRIVFFLVGHIFLIGIYDANVRLAVATWSHVSAKGQLQVEIATSAVAFVSFVVWKWWLVNVNWKKLAILVSVLYVVLYALLTLTTAYDHIRAEWFYTLMLAVLELPRAWLKLFVVILPTEIADVGTEGVTMGLINSFEVLVSVACRTVSEVLAGAFHLDASLNEIVADAPATRTNVADSGLIFFAINLLCVFPILLLPSQKLDAQRRRASAARSPYMGTAIAFIFTLLLVVDLVVNVAVLAAA